MAAKKSASKKGNSPTLLEKISHQAAYVKDKLIEEKDQVVQVAGETFDALKEKIHDFRTKKGPAAKKGTAQKKSAVQKKGTKASAKKAPVKKASPKAVQAVKKVAKKGVEKVNKVIKKADASRGKPKSR